MRVRVRACVRACARACAFKDKVQYHRISSAEDMHSFIYFPCAKIDSLIFFAGLLWPDDFGKFHRQYIRGLPGRRGMCLFLFCENLYLFLCTRVALSLLLRDIS